MIKLEEAETTLKYMKSRKTSQPTSFVVELLRSGRKSCLESLTKIFMRLFQNKLLNNWMLSLLVPIYKGKGGCLNSNSYRGIKLLEHVFK